MKHSNRYIPLRETTRTFQNFYNMAVEKASISIAVEIVGFLLNKARDWVSNKLKDRDLTNEELRKLIVCDLNEINRKLDSLSLKDLAASRRFFKDGMSFLILALGKPSEDQGTREGPNEATDMSTDGASGSLNVALTFPQAIQKLQISSEKRFEEAKKSFHDARKDATRAFSNNSLEVKDRIMACTISVTARIFESGLEDAEAAVFASLSALEDLHGLPAIKDMLKVFLRGGMRSWRNKAERLENIMSVLLINHALFDFAAKCSSKHPNVFTWPRIEFADRTAHPILHACVIMAKTSSREEFGQQLNRMIVDSRISGQFWYFAVNSRGETIILDDNKITVIYSSSESKGVKLSDRSGSNVVERRRKALAVDSDDNVYAVRHLKTRDENGRKGKFVLRVLDENYNIKHDSILLDFLDAGENTGVRIAVDKNKNIIMMTTDNQVYVCYNTGHLKLKFDVDRRSPGNIGIINEHDIMVRTDDGRAVFVYTTEGDLRSTVEVPESHEVVQVAFHHGIGRIIVLTNDTKQKCCSLLCYSETGELENSVQGLPRWSGITSHPSGAFAVLQDKSITLI